MDLENKKLWFKRKPYGWGWVPCSWEGWLVTLGYIILIVPISAQKQAFNSVSDLWLTVIGPFIVLTAALIFICYKKGEKPKWQWGNGSVAHYPKVGVGVMIWKDGKVLMGKRKNSFGEGEYCFPGGHLEYMESFEDAVRREAQEECGLEIKNIQWIAIGNIMNHKPKHFVSIGFSAEWAGGEPQTLEPDKCEEWKWYDIEALPNPIFPHSQILIEAHKTGKNYYDSKGI